VAASEPSEFHQASTQVMAIPPNVVKNVADAKRKKEAKSMAGGTAALGGGSAVDAFADEVATRINSKQEIHGLLQKSRDSEEEEEEGSLDLSVPDTLGRLEDGGETDAGLDLSISDNEERPSKPSKTPGEPLLQGQVPAFPTDALREYALAMRAYLLSQKVYIKAAAGAGALLVLILFVGILVFVFSGSDTHVGFADENQTLAAGPGTNGLYPQVATIERGEEVTVFDSGEIGDFLMVRDLMGRAGFLPAQSVSGFRPAARSGVPFVGCRHSPIEETTEPCVERAHVQFDSCREICEQSGQDDMACLEQCQRQMLHCIERCEGGAEDSPAVPEPEPVFDDPGAEPTAAATPPPAEPVKPVKPKRKKKKKKKRRKR